MASETQQKEKDDKSTVLESKTAPSAQKMQNTGGSEATGNPVEQGVYKVGPGHPPREHQFGQPLANPRSTGSWRKEDTLRYKLERMGQMSEAEIVRIANDKNAPMFERRVARSLLKENDWKTTESMINQVYGAPKVKEEISLEAKVSSINLNVQRFDGEKPCEK